MPYFETRTRHLEDRRRYVLKKFPPPDDKLNTTQAEYYYEFKGAPRQKDDMLIIAIKKTVRQLSKTHVFFAASNVRVFNMDLSPAPTLRSTKSTKIYAFKQFFVEFPAAAEVKIVKNAQSLSPDAIIVRDMITKSRNASTWSWISLEKWLLALPISNYMTDGVNRQGVERIIRCQQIWWSKIGKSFRLLELPRELRLNVFRHVLGEHIYPERCYDHITHSYKVVFGTKDRSDSLYRNHPEELDRNAIQRPDVPNYRILAVSKQVRREALEAGWVGTYKHFLNASLLFDVLGAQITPSEFNWLSKIHLNLTVKQYFKFFGLKINPEVRILESKSNGRRLAGLTKRGLKHLELHFRDPYTYKLYDRSTPWSAFIDKNSHRDWFKDDDKLTGMQRYPCQKTVVDWILTVAFPFIKDIPNVWLSGAVKTSSKKKWAYILNANYKVPLKKNCFCGFDFHGEIKAILGRPVHGTPVCSCPAKYWEDRGQQGIYSFDHEDTYVEPPPPAPRSPSVPSSLVKPGVLWSSII